MHPFITISALLFWLVAAFVAFCLFVNWSWHRNYRRYQRELEREEAGYRCSGKAYHDR